MRSATLIFLSTLLSVSSGCAFLKRFNETEPQRQFSSEPVTAVTAEQLVAYLNQQVGYLQTLRYPNVSLSVESPEGNHTLSESTLICQQPGNFHLAAGKLVTGKLIEIGSNQREFWMVTERPLPEQYIYCSHDDFKRGAAKNLPFPFDPKWALQALGMSTYDPSLQYSVKTDQVKQEHLLSFDSVTPQGDEIRNEIAFDANPASGTTPQVRRHAIYDREDRLIAMARIDSVETVTTDYDVKLAKSIIVQVPTRVHLDWPIQQSSMEMRLNDALVNRPLTEQEQQRFFNRPNPEGVNPINLASGLLAP